MNQSDLAHHTQIYDQILAFYDIAEQLIHTVEHARVKDPEMQLDLIEPIVLQIEEGTDVLAEEYRLFVQEGNTPGAFTNKRIERALAQIFGAIETYQRLLTENKIAQA